MRVIRVPANHPAYFNGKVLAESLGGGTFRVTRDNGDRPPISAVSTFTFGWSYSEHPNDQDVEIDGKMTTLFNSGEGNVANPRTPAFAEAKAMLESRGLTFAADADLWKKVARKFVTLANSSGQKIEDLHAGDPIAIISGKWGEDQLDVSLFRLPKDAKEFEMSEDDPRFEEGTCGHFDLKQNTLKIDSMSGLWPAYVHKAKRLDEEGLTIVKLDPSEFESIVTDVHYRAGQNSPEEGRKLYAEAVELYNNWHTDTRESFDRFKRRATGGTTKNRLGGVLS